MKNFLIGLFCVCISIILSYSAVTMELKMAKYNISLDQIERYIMVYANKVDNIEILNKQGTDVTEQTLKETSFYAKIGNYQKVYQYYFGNNLVLTYKLN